MNPIFEQNKKVNVHNIHKNHIKSTLYVKKREKQSVEYGQGRVQIYDRFPFRKNSDETTILLFFYFFFYQFIKISTNYLLVGAQ